MEKKPSQTAPQCQEPQTVKLADFPCFRREAELCWVLLTSLYPAPQPPVLWVGAAARLSGQKPRHFCPLNDTAARTHETRAATHPKNPAPGLTGQSGLGRGSLLSQAPEWSLVIKRPRLGQEVEPVKHRPPPPRSRKPAPRRPGWVLGSCAGLGVSPPLAL